MKQNFTSRARIGRRSFMSGLFATAASLPAQSGVTPLRSLFLTDLVDDLKPGTDITSSLDMALQIAMDRKIGEVVLPAGEYLVQSIKMRSRVKLKGLGRGSTRLKAVPGYTGSFVVLGNGPIIHTSIEGMTLVGGTPAAATNPSQWAIDFEATAVPGSVPPNGGFWWSALQDVQLIGFSRGVRLQGGAVPGNYQLPHQFVSVRDFVVFLSKDAMGPALKITGQVAQFVFEQCQFDHNGGIGDLTLVEIGRVGDSSASAGPEPSLLHFSVCTFQDARQAVIMAHSQNVSFDSCWFEQLQAGIQVGKDSVGTTISGCRFANAASAQPAVEFLDNAHGTVSSNVFAGARTKSSIRVASSSRVTQTNNIQTLGASE
ncbi:glycoside hydrolase family 55 protein [Bradyrhizobium sp. CCGUVB1N3]|uniref:glycoside hydrolase family 55 protein n=1 Tax=Bradyrhizobium sp. CCGUVB1N3 TaxID=2949629 RepID=UPI0020B1A511|nr:glycoside hydrolase family 55 protein [Bradyrhizobium sp. CCGUVB1N3]MCP3472148.1 glycoside hydrolase family 55 protein [Bradyrhizobium sp. CCGUVB1N3]